jgi:exonuclease III
MGLFKIKVKDEDVFFCLVYKHPNHSVKDFWAELKEFLRKNLRNTKNSHVIDKLFLVGDFNIDFVELKTEGKTFVDKCANKLGLKHVLIKRPTTDRDTCIDNVLTNVEKRELNYASMLYESYFSDHKPIWISIDICN